LTAGEQKSMIKIYHELLKSVILSNGFGLKSPEMTDRQTDRQRDSDFITVFPDVLVKNITGIMYLT